MRYLLFDRRSQFQAIVVATNADEARARAMLIVGIYTAPRAFIDAASIHIAPCPDYRPGLLVFDQDFLEGLAQPRVDRDRNDTQAGNLQ